MNPGLPPIQRFDSGILLADDEPVVLEVCTGLLKELGFKVFAAKNGKEALDVYEANRDEIEVVILDMFMPVMDGRETFAKMREMNPDLKVLVSSGCQADERVAEMLDQGCSGMLEKPFRLSHLVQKMNELFAK